MFKLPINKDYYKPTLVKSGYNNNYIQYESKGDKILTVKEYLGLTESYLADIINDYKSKGEWKIRLTAEINFTSLKPDSDETSIMHTKSENKEIMIGSDTNEVIKELFKSFLQRYQESLHEKMRGSEFEFDGIHLLYYDFNKISLNRGGSYIELMMMSRKCTVSTAVLTGVCTFDAEKGLSKSHFLYFFSTFLDRKGIVWI